MRTAKELSELVSEAIGFFSEKKLRLARTTAEEIVGIDLANEWVRMEVNGNMGFRSRVTQCLSSQMDHHQMQEDLRRRFLQRITTESNGGEKVIHNDLQREIRAWFEREGKFARPSTVASALGRPVSLIDDELDAMVESGIIKKGNRGWYGVKMARSKPKAGRKPEPVHTSRMSPGVPATQPLDEGAAKLAAAALNREADVGVGSGTVELDDGLVVEFVGFADEVPLWKIRGDDENQLFRLMYRMDPVQVALLADQ